MTSASAHKTTADVIKGMLRARLGRQWRVGERLPPTRELARQLGWGQTNTQQAVRALAAEGFLASRQRRGTYVLRAPSMEAQQAGDLQRQRDLTQTTVRLFHGGNPPDAFIHRMIDGFRSIIAPTGARVEVDQDALLHRRDFCDQPGDALVFFNPGSGTPLVLGRNQIVSVISTAARMEVEGTERYDVVSVDELHGGMLAGRVLHRSGCRRVGFLGRGEPPAGDRCDQTSALRLLGLESTWGAAVQPEDIFLRDGYSLTAGGRMFGRYLRLTGERPDGIFAASDELAVGFISAAAAHDLVPGKDYQIVGFDGQDVGQMFGGGQLTTIKVPAAEMGRRAAQLLLERFAQPDRPVHRIQLECSVQPGTTTISCGLVNSSK